MLLRNYLGIRNFFNYSYLRMLLIVLIVLSFSFLFCSCSNKLSTEYFDALTVKDVKTITGFPDSLEKKIIVSRNRKAGKIEFKKPGSKSFLVQINFWIVDDLEKNYKKGRKRYEGLTAALKERLEEISNLGWRALKYRQSGVNWVIFWNENEKVEVSVAGCRDKWIWRGGTGRAISDYYAEYVSFDKLEMLARKQNDRLNAL